MDANYKKKEKEFRREKESRRRKKQERIECTSSMKERGNKKMEKAVKNIEKCEGTKNKE